MAKRFVRLDLSAAARDFETVAVEPGIPLLDKSNTNYRVLCKWLGRLIAEPKWHGDSVDLFVCDDQQARLIDVRCDPIAADDLRRNWELAKEFEELSKRLERIKPEPREVNLHEAIAKHFRKLTGESGPAQRECHFFKYRDARTWKLVWGWGYQRKDLAPATAAICTNPNCALLFVRHADRSRNCPACEKAVPTGQPKPRRSLLLAFAGVALVALVAAALGYFIPRMVRRTQPPPELGLYATPEKWEGPVGSQVQFAVVNRTKEDKEEDVTGEVVVVAENPRVLRVEDYGAIVFARSPGKSAVYFYRGDQDTKSTVDVQPPKNPRSITIDPSEMTLGVETTAQLRVLGDFGGEKSVDLTKDAEWEPAGPGTIFCHKGRLEGVAKGKMTLVARYRATPNDPYLKAEAIITVVEEEYKSLELAMRPSPVIEGKAARLEAVVRTASGDKRSVLNAAGLKLEVTPPQLATLEGEYLRAAHVGKGSLKGFFGSLSASCPLEVLSDVGPKIFLVKPQDLQLAVGETFELQITTSSKEPIRLTSSAPGIVEVLSDRWVAGRALGKAEITVSQEAREAKVLVEVTPAKVTSIRFLPNPVFVPVDGSVQLRLVGLSGQGQEIDLAPDGIVWERLPTDEFADLDLKTLRVRGRLPTGETPQTLAARWEELRAKAQIHVKASPLKIELSPSGSILLPVGQRARLRAWGQYGGGRRVELPSERLEWKLDPPEISGLELDRRLAAVRATKAGVGPLSVRASYQGCDSNPVEFRSVDVPATLELQADRSLILVGDTGQFRVSVQGSTTPDVELEGVRFTSSAKELLEVRESTGTYRALAPGTVTVTAKHPEVKSSATREIEILQDDEVRLVLRPGEIKLVVGSRQQLGLYRVAGDREEEVPTAGDTSGVRVAIDQPRAVDWKPPFLLGVAPAKPFGVTASHGSKIARAIVEVQSFPSAGQSEIRVVPATASLAPGQMLSPRVEQRLRGAGGLWVEVNPSKVRWTVPDSIVWTPASGDLRPQLTPGQAAKGKVALSAEYAGFEATLTINVQPSGVPPKGPLRIAREPGGEELPVGSRQRYTVMVQDGGALHPVAGVEWAPAFENDYVRWDPPVLTATRPGHEERLYAQVGDQRVWFRTWTVGRPPEPGSPPLRHDKPAEVRIVCGEKPPVTIPVRAYFLDFRVEAIFPGEPPADVTRRATLRIQCDDPTQAPVAVESGGLLGVQPGKAVVQAAFNGVQSSEGLAVEVVDRLDLTSIRIEPPKVKGLGLGETVDLRAIGFTGSGGEVRRVGDISLLPGVKWESDNPDVVQADGPTITARGEGTAEVTVTAGTASATAEVSVRRQLVGATTTEVHPRELRLRPGETAWLGRDIVIRSGGVDVSRRAEVSSSAPSIARYNAGNRSVEGVAPGGATLAITTAGGGSASLPVHVDLPEPISGSIVIEPATASLAVGETKHAHVILVTDAGQRVDRTGSASLSSDNPQVLAVQGSRVTGLAAGQSKLLARLPGIEEPGTASFTVTEESFTELRVIPLSLQLAVGEDRPIQVMGIGPSGRRELQAHPALKVTAAGEKPDAIEWRGDGTVRGVAPGNASLQVAWRELTAPPVPVRVSIQPLTRLAIDPPEATVPIGRLGSFRVTARRGGRQVALGPEDGVQLRVSDPAVARPGPDLTVTGLGEGTTEVAAQLGSQRAVAKLTIVPPPPGSPPEQQWKGLWFIPDVLTLQMGVPGTNVRLVHNGEDVAHECEVEVKDPVMVDVRPTGPGPVFTPKRIGETQATATYRGRPARQPLVIRVVDTPPEPPPQAASLSVRPDPLSLIAGTTGEFQQVQIVPPDGSAPIDVDYRVEGGDPKIVAVEGEKILRGIAPGEAQVTVLPVNPAEAYKDLRATVTIDVAPSPTEGTQGTKPTELVLAGPSRTAVNAEVNYRAEMVYEDGRRREVTNNGAVLVVDSETLAEIRSGCTLVAKEPGMVNVRARHGEMISNSLPLRIDEIGRVDRLELDIDRRPMSVGETRSYKVWGYPSGGGPRQDLTGQVIDAMAGDAKNVPEVALRVIKPQGVDGIVSHTPPNVVAKAPGRFQMVAHTPELKREIVDLEILGAGPEPLALNAVPPSITIRGGERTPPLQAIAALPTGQSRPVDAQWTSENEAVVAPDPQAPGQFLGRAVGKTRLRAVFGTHEAFVDVTVAGDPFHKVSFEEEPDFRPGNCFAVFINVEATWQEAGLEYCVYPAGGEGPHQWKAASADGSRLRVRLASPELRLGPKGTLYHLRVEARDKEQQTAGRYPLAFKLEERPPTVEQKPGAGLK